MPRYTYHPKNALRDAARAYSTGDGRDKDELWRTSVGLACWQIISCLKGSIKCQHAVRFRDDERAGLTAQALKTIPLSVGPRAGEPPPTLFDYLPADGLLVDESHVAIPQTGGVTPRRPGAQRDAGQYGFRLPSALLDNRRAEV